MAFDKDVAWDYGRTTSSDDPRISEQLLKQLRDFHSTLPDAAATCFFLSSPAAPKQLHEATVAAVRRARTEKELRRPHRLCKVDDLLLDGFIERATRLYLRHYASAGGKPPYYAAELVATVSHFNPSVAEALFPGVMAFSKDVAWKHNHTPAVGEAMTSSLPSNNDSFAPGMAPSTHSPSRAELLHAQFAHPATRAILTGLGATLPDMPYAMIPTLPAVSDPEHRQFTQELSQHELAEDGLLLRRSRRQHVTDSGEVYEHGPVQTGRIVLPPKYHQWAMAGHHDRMGHQGVRKCFPSLVYRYYWDKQNKMQSDFSAYCGDCRVCARCKLSRHKTGSGSVVNNGEHPFDVCSADFFTVGRKSSKGAKTDPTVVMGSANLDPLAPDDALVAGDEPEATASFDGTVSFACQFSRMIKVAPVKGQPTSRTIARLLINEVIQHYGTPRAVRSDHGSNFVSKVIKALYTHFNITMEASAPYMHRTIGLVERWHSVLKVLISTHFHVTGDARWHVYLPFMVLSFNAAINTATGYSPFFVANLRDCRLPMDSLSSSIVTKTERKLPDWFREMLAARGVVYDMVNRKLNLNALHAVRSMNLKRDVSQEFLPGQKVLIIKGAYIDKKLAKAAEPTEGPFTVLRVLKNGNVELSDLGSRKLINKFSAERLIHFPTRRTIAQCELSQWYPVEKIVDRRVHKSGSSLEYKLHWAGFNKSYRTWLPSEYLLDITPLLVDYNSKYPLPAEFVTPDQPRETRGAVDTPPISDEALKRTHFRRASHKQESLPTPVEDHVVGEIPATTTTPSIHVEEPTEPSTLCDFEAFTIGRAVEVRLAKVPKGFDIDSWLPAVVKRTRTLAARHGSEERRFVVVVFDNDRHCREHSVPFTDAGRLTIRIRNDNEANAAVASGVCLQPVWVYCDHGAVLVATGVGAVEAPISFARCVQLECTLVCGEWFRRISSTTAWSTSFGGGQPICFPTILNR